jgi:hypothetical protein
LRERRRSRRDADRGTGPRFEARPRPEEQKYGLYLVDQLADRRGSEPVDEQNRTWFELDRS